MSPRWQDVQTAQKAAGPGWLAGTPGPPVAASVSPQPVKDSQAPAMARALLAGREVRGAKRKVLTRARELGLEAGNVNNAKQH